MSRRVAVSVLLFVACRPLYGKLNINTDLVSRAVVFIYGATINGEVDGEKALATGFLVSIPVQQHPGSVYVVLMTARHVLDPQWSGCVGANPSRVYLRLNRKTYEPGKDTSGVGFVAVDLVSGEKQLFSVSSYNDIDAAIVVLKPDRIDAKQYGIEPLPLSVFATSDEAREIGVGDEVVSAGLIPGYAGQSRNYPIFKFGQVSGTSDEPLPTACGPGLPRRVIRGWMIAANLIPGNSGSPVFYSPSGANGLILGGRGTVTRPVLIGLQSSSLLGADVAVITPVDFIFEIIKQMGLPDADLTRGTTHQTPAPDGIY